MDRNEKSDYAVFPDAYRLGILYQEILRSHAKEKTVQIPQEAVSAREEVLLYLKGLDGRLSYLSRELSMKKGLSLLLARNERTAETGHGGTADGEDEGQQDYNGDESEAVEKSMNGVYQGSILDDYYGTGEFSDDLYDIHRRCSATIAMLSKGTLSVHEAEKTVRNLGIITQPATSRMLAGLGFAIPSADGKTADAIRTFAGALDALISHDPYVMIRRSLMGMGGNTCDLLDMETEFDVSEHEYVKLPRIFDRTEGMTTGQGFSRFIDNVLTTVPDCRSPEDSMAFLVAADMLLGPDMKLKKEYSSVDAERLKKSSELLTSFFGPEVRNLRDWDKLMKKTSAESFDGLFRSYLENRASFRDTASVTFSVPPLPDTPKAAPDMGDYMRTMKTAFDASRMWQEVRNDLIGGVRDMMLLNPVREASGGRNGKGKKTEGYRLPEGFEDSRFSFSFVVSDNLAPIAGRTLYDAVNYYSQLLKQDAALRSLPLRHAVPKDGESPVCVEIGKILSENARQLAVIRDDIEKYLSTHGREDIRMELEASLRDRHYPLSGWVGPEIATELRNMIMNLAYSIQSEGPERDYVINEYSEYYRQHRDTYQKDFLERFFGLISGCDLRTKSGREAAGVAADELASMIIGQKEDGKAMCIGELCRFPSFRKSFESLTAGFERAGKEKLVASALDGYDRMVTAYAALNALLAKDSRTGETYDIQGICVLANSCLSETAMHLVREMTEQALPDEMKKETPEGIRARELFFSRMAEEICRGRLLNTERNISRTRESHGASRDGFTTDDIRRLFGEEGDGKASSAVSDAVSDGPGITLSADLILSAVSEPDGRFSDMDEVLRLIDCGSLSLKEAAGYFDSKVCASELKNREIAFLLSKAEMNASFQYNEIQRLYDECFVPRDRERFAAECGKITENNPLLNRDMLLRFFDTGNDRAFLSLMYASPEGMNTVMKRTDLNPETFRNPGDRLAGALLEGSTEYLSALKGEAGETVGRDLSVIDGMNGAEREVYYALHLATRRVFAPETLICVKDHAMGDIVSAIDVSRQVREALKYFSDTVVREERVFGELTGAYCEYMMKTGQKAAEILKDSGSRESVWPHQAVYPRVAEMSGTVRGGDSGLISGYASPGWSETGLLEGRPVAKNSALRGLSDSGNAGALKDARRMMGLQPRHQPKPISQDTLLEQRRKAMSASLHKDPETAMRTRRDVTIATVREARYSEGYGSGR